MPLANNIVVDISNPPPPVIISCLFRSAVAELAAVTAPRAEEAVFMRHPRLPESEVFARLPRVPAVEEEEGKANMLLEGRKLLS